MQDEKLERLKTLTLELLSLPGESPDDVIKKLQKTRKMEQDDAVIVLNYIAAQEKHPKIITYLAKEIGRYKDRRSTQVLLGILTGFKENRDQYLDARIAAVTTLGNLKDEMAIIPLMAIMNDRDESYRIRLWAADALGKIGNSQATLPLMKIMSDEEEKSVYLKESAAKALGMIGDERAVDSLINILETRQGMLDKFAYLKEKVVEALGKFKQKKTNRLHALKNVLYDESPPVRASAIEALAEIEDDEVTGIIEPMIYDDNENVARNAVVALFNREGKEYLLNLLEKNDLPSVCREEIMELLEEEDDEDELED